MEEDERDAARERAKVILKPMPVVLDLFLKARQNRQRSHVKRVIELARRIAKETEEKRLMAGHSTVVRAYACVIFAHGLCNAPMKLEPRKLKVLGHLPARQAIVSAVTILYNKKNMLEAWGREFGASIAKLEDCEDRVWEDVRDRSRFIAGKMEKDRGRDERKKDEAEEWETRTVGCGERVEELRRELYLQAVEGVLG